MSVLPFDRLRRLAERPRPSPPAETEFCELCGQPVPSAHAHLLDIDARRPVCVCRACGVLFDRAPAGSRRYRRMSSRRDPLPSFVLDDATWQALGVPVALAFFVPQGADGTVRAFYPSPLGATDAVVDGAAWSALVAANPALATCEPDVECLLVRRSRDAREYWLLGLDVAYALVAIVRRHWKGLGGGDTVRAEINAFFDRLARGLSPF